MLTRVPPVQERQRSVEKMPKNTGIEEVSFERDPSSEGKFLDCTFFWAERPYLQAFTGENRGRTRIAQDDPGAPHQGSQEDYHAS